MADIIKYIIMGSIPLSELLGDGSKTRPHGLLQVALVDLLRPHAGFASQH